MKNNKVSNYYTVFSYINEILLINRFEDSEIDNYKINLLRL